MMLEHFKLEPNCHHFHYSKKIPQKIEIIPAGKNANNESLMLFSRNEVDHITTIDASQSIGKIPFSRSQKDVNIHITSSILLYLMAFTEKGIKNINIEKRIQIAKLMKKIFWHKYNVTEVVEPANQIFPVFGEGELSEVMLRNVSEKYDSVKGSLVIKNKLLIWDSSLVFLRYPEVMKVFYHYFPNTKIVKGGGFPGFVNYKEN